MAYSVTWRETQAIANKLLDYLKVPTNTITDVKRAVWAMTLRLPVPEGHPQYANNAQLISLRNTITAEVGFTNDEHNALMYRNNNVRHWCKGQIKPWFDDNVNKPDARPKVESAIANMASRDMTAESAIKLLRKILDDIERDL